MRVPIVHDENIGVL